MERPVNVFWNFYNLLKDLVVSVKLGSSEAVPTGSVLEQLSNTKFKVTDNEGNEGVCELVNKKTNDLNDNEMSLIGFVLHSSTFVCISSIEVLRGAFIILSALAVLHVYLLNPAKLAPLRSAISRFQVVMSEWRKSDKLE